LFNANVFSHSDKSTRSDERKDMASRVVETILPTTMVGSYPRPHWFTQQLLGRDVRVAFKEVQH
jgi:hypothetical protein